MANFDNIFKVTHNNLLPNQGCILISEPFLQDIYFQRSVILLVEHNDEGSMGFVLNKCTHLKVNEFFPELENYPTIPIYLGGPVSSNRLFFIHTLGNKIPESVAINDGLFFGGDFDSMLEYIMTNGNYEGKVKFFLGYSGWSKEQLMKEIERNSWVVSRTAGNDSMLHAEDDKFWKRSVKYLGQKYRTWMYFPKDPHLN